MSYSSQVLVIASPPPPPPSPICFLRFCPSPYSVLDPPQRPPVCKKTSPNARSDPSWHRGALWSHSTPGVYFQMCLKTVTDHICLASPGARFFTGRRDRQRQDSRHQPAPTTAADDIRHPTRPALAKHIFSQPRFTEFQTKFLILSQEEKHKLAERGCSDAEHRAILLVFFSRGVCVYTLFIDTF